MSDTLLFGMAAGAAWGSHLPCHFLTSTRLHPAAFRSLKPFRLDSTLTRSRLRIRCCGVPTIGRSDDGPKSFGSGEDEPAIGREEQIVGSANEDRISLRGNLQSDFWQQVKDIAMFAGPATGLWICSPMMSLIDTAVVGQSSAVELAALGPGTVVCDYMSFVFMFLSIATSNLVATSLARKDREEAQEHISMLLFVALVCGFGMLFIMKLFGNQILSAFIGPKNLHIVPAASSYIQIRGLAWPAVLVGMVAQSASLAMKDSFSPLKVLIIASLVNGFGDIILCSFWHYGIAGAAWATMVSQFIGAILMIDSLNKSGFSAFQLSVPSPSELLQIVELAAPVFITTFSKVAFYSFLTYFATSMGTITLAAHQVMLGVYSMCGVWGEPLSQTAQSFMPELIYGVKRNLEKARMLLQSLVTIGIIAGCILATIGTVVPWLFPYIFTSDLGVSNEMRTVLLPYSVAIMITPPTLSLEGTLLAWRDLGFLSLSMISCFCLGVLLLLIANKGFGLPGCWWALSVFQWVRFFSCTLAIDFPSKHVILG